MKNMCSMVPAGACPNCGHKQFVVFESNSMAYLTNRDGEIIDSKQLDYTAIGKCSKCGNTYDMFPTNDSFIPMTDLRKVFYTTSPHFIECEEPPKIDNPMEAN